MSKISLIDQDEYECNQLGQFIKKNMIDKDVRKSFSTQGWFLWSVDPKFTKDMIRWVIYEIDWYKHPEQLKLLYKHQSKLFEFLEKMLNDNIWGSLSSPPADSRSHVDSQSPMTKLAYWMRSKMIYNHGGELYKLYIMPMGGAYYKPIDNIATFIDSEF